MKILYVITKANWGGAQKYVYELATAAKAAGHEVVAVYGEEGLLAEKFAQVGIRTIRLPVMRNEASLGAVVRATRSLRALLKQEHPDIVHLNSSLAGIAGALASRFEKVPRIIFTAHGWAFNEERSWWQKLVIYKLVWWTILLSHQTICVSRAIRRDVAWMPFVKKKLVVIYNGVEAAEYKSREEARAALWPEHEGGVWMGMLSELHPTKRVEDALEAFALLRETCPDTRLIVMGEGQERARLEWLIRESNLSGYAHLAGLLPGGDAYLKAFDIFLHASRSEALSLAVLEAGLAGLPIVATNVGGIPEIVEDGVTGVLVPPYEPAAMAEALAELIQDPARATALGKALAHSVGERFNAEQMIEKTLALYTTHPNTR